MSSKKWTSAQHEPPISPKVNVSKKIKKTRLPHLCLVGSTRSETGDFAASVAAAEDDDVCSCPLSNSGSMWFSRDALPTAHAGRWPQNSCPVDDDGHGRRSSR